MSRIPLVAAAVGALLVGGATTGGTFASWTSQRPLHANDVQSGQLSFTATSPGAVAVDQTAGSTADTTFVLDDTSTGKNNQQRITASVAGTPAGITAGIGTSCATATSASVAVDTTPTSPNQSLCVRVTVTNQPTTAVSGDVTVSISGAQRPTGWSTPISTIRVPVTIISGLSLECGGSLNPTPRFQITWTDAGALVYSVYRASTPNGPWQLVAVTPSREYAEGQWGQNQKSYFKVEASPNGILVTSNVLQVERNGNSNQFKCGAP